jgi:hypothetical protein
VLRRRDITVIAAAAALATAPAAAPAASVNARAKAKVVKPLVLRSVQDLDLGILVLSPGSWSGATVMLSPTGVLTCPANVTCSGAAQVAIYNASGTNGQTAIINAPDVTLVNQTDPSSRLTLTVDGPEAVTFTNSGVKGINFPLGGSITVDSTTADGEYSGTFEVTAEYQ